MRRHSRNRRQAGLTVVELLLVLAIICILWALILPMRQKCKYPRMACLNNLKQVALSELVWANDHSSDKLPAQFSTNAGGLCEFLLEGKLTSYYQSLSNELGSPKILVCPFDQRKPVEAFDALTTNHLSYFLNMDASPATNISTVLHGDRQIEFSPIKRGAILTLEPNMTPRWMKGIHYKEDEVGNVACTDGSVQGVFNVAEIQEVFRPSMQAGHTFIFP